MAEAVSQSFGEAPEYGSNRIGDYLKLADEDLRSAANVATRHTRHALLGYLVTGAGITIAAGNTLVSSFNQVSMAATITAGLGAAAFAYTQYKSHQLKNNVDAHIQHFDKA